MMFPVTLSVLVAVAVLVPSILGCCGPEKWEGIVGMSGGLVVNGSPGETTGLLNVSLDATASKFVIRGVSYWHQIPLQPFPIQQVTLQDFKNGKQYDVYNGHCSVTNLPIIHGLRINCIPPGAQKLLSTYYGPEDNKLEFDIYKYLHVNGKPMMQSVTKDNCTTIGYKVNTYNGFINMGIMGHRAGVQDMSVFDVPKECKGV